MKSRAISFLKCFILIAVLSGCGITIDADETLNLYMHGSNYTPSGVDPNNEDAADPLWQEYVLTNVAFDGTGGQVVLYNNSNNVESIRIVEREQLIYEKDISDLEDTVFSSVAITFKSTVVGAYDSKKDYTFTLTDPIISHAEEFTVETGKDLNVRIKVRWRKTVDLNSGTMIEPDMTVSINADDD